MPRVSFEQASQSLMDAAIDPTRWTAAMEVVAGYSGSTGAVLLSVEGRGPGTPHSRSLEEELAAPLSQAAAMARALDYASAVGALDAYEAIGCASFLINRYGRVIQHNKQAGRLLGDGLEISNGFLRCLHPSDTTMLAKLVAAYQCKAEGAAGVNRLVVVRRQSKRPLVIRCLALKGAAENIFSAVTTILLVSDTEKRSPPTAGEALVKAFGLTPTEAILVSNLERDMTLKSAANRMNISFETARTHLKRIFAKTQTCRQAELLMLLRRIEVC